MLAHVHSNILDNINLAVFRINFLTEKTATNKHSDIFFRITHNIYKIKLNPLGTFHIFKFPIRCVKRGAVERSTIH